MPRSAPVLLGLFGLLLLAVEVWATIRNRRRLQACSRRQRFGYRVLTWAGGVPLVCLSLFANYNLRPNVRVLGAPFPATAWEYNGKHWVDFVGPFTLGAFIGNGAVFFLLPQVLLAAGMWIAKRR